MFLLFLTGVVDMKYNCKSVLEEYFSEYNWRKNENANTNIGFSNLQNFISNKTLANEFLNSLSKEERDAHVDGLIHIHNLESGGLVPYCSGFNLKYLVMNGMKTMTISSRPARHFSSILDQLLNWIYISQQEFSGAQAFGDVDTILAPFVKSDGLTYKEVKQNIQRLIYNLNMTMRASNQTPFSNLSLNYCTPRFLENEDAIVGGEPAPYKYSDCQKEIEMIDTAISEIMKERDPSGVPYTFPLLTVNLTSRFPWDSEAAREMALVSSSIGSYYWMNYLGSGISENTIRSMCCRLNINLKELSDPHGLWNTGEGTGSLGVCTINFPRLGFDTRTRDEAVFFEELDHRMEIAVNILLKRKSNILKYKDKLMPFNTMNGWSPRNYYITIGVLGFHEMCLNMFGSDITRNIDFVTKVLNHMREWVIKKQVLHKQLINIELVPGEGSSYRLAYIDRKHYPSIITSGTRHAPYYTTLLVPPHIELDVFERASIEEKVLPLFTGGTIFRIFLGEQTLDSRATLELIKKISTTKIPYYDITATFSLCKKESKIYRGVVYTCPSCHEPLEVYSRVVGYYRPVSKWNIGRKEEFKNRKYPKIVIKLDDSNVTPYHN